MFVTRCAGRARHSLSPGDTRLELKLAKSLEIQERYEQAVALLEPLVRREPENSEALRRLGSVYLESGRYDAAVPLLSSAVNETPADGLLHYYLGYALAGAGQQKTAVAELRTALQLEPGNQTYESMLQKLLT